MAIGIGNRQFRPRLWATVTTVVLVSLTCSLGNWQLNRAREKRALYASFEMAEVSGGALPVDSLQPDSPPFTPITAFGRFDNAHQILLDAMMQESRPGYLVLTPLLRDTLPAVLVNRGWIAAGEDRGRLPMLDVTDEERRVTGFKGHIPEPAMRLGGASSEGSTWPRVALYPTRQQIQSMLGYPVLDTVLLLGSHEPDGYLRAWRPQLITPERHLGYAVQWFAMALTLIVIYVVVNLRRPGVDNHD